MEDYIFSVITSGSVPLSGVIILIIYYIRQDIGKVTKILNNGLVDKVARLTTEHLLSSQELRLWKDDFKEDLMQITKNCQAHTKEINEALSKINKTS